MRALAGALWMLVTLGGCSLSPLPEPRDYLRKTGDILSGAQAARLLHPCSRPLPQYDSLWTPGREDIISLEHALSWAVRRQSWQRPGTRPRHPLSAYEGQYAGYYYAGLKYVYGNFFPAGLADAPVVTARPYDACGESKDLFGVRYSISSEEIEEIQVNVSGMINDSTVHGIVEMQ